MPRPAGAVRLVEVLPTRLRVGSLAAIAAYGAIGWAVLARAGQLGIGHGILRVATWVIAGYFLVGAGATWRRGAAPNAS